MTPVFKDTAKQMKTKLNALLMLTAFVIALSGFPASAQNCRGSLADARVQSLAAEVLAKMDSDYESPADARRSFAKKLEDRAKLERYPPIRVGRPGHLQPIRLADIIGSLNGGKNPLIDVCFPKLAQLEARIAQRSDCPA